MNRGDFFPWVARTFRVLVAVFHRDELLCRAVLLGRVARQGKFATVEHRRQPTERGRYPEALVSA